MKNVLRESFSGGRLRHACKVPAVQIASSQASFAFPMRSPPQRKPHKRGPLWFRCLLAYHPGNHEIVFARDTNSVVPSHGRWVEAS